MNYLQRFRQGARPALVLITLMVLTLALSCGQQSKTKTEATDSEPVTEQAAEAQKKTSAEETKAADTRMSENELAKKPTQPAKPKPKPKPKPEPSPKTVTVEIPAGMNMVISLAEALETGQISTGDEFNGTLVDSIVIAGKTVFEAGANVTGTVLNAVASGRLKTDAELSLTLQRIAGIEVQTDVIEEKASSHSARNKKLIGGGAIVGGILGALKGKDVKGAVVGAAAGAAAGTGAAALTGKKNLRYEAGTLLQFTLAKSVKATVPK